MREIDKKHQWAKEFKQFLITQQDTQIFEQYGGIPRLESIKKLFDQKKTALIKGWNNCLKKSIVPVQNKKK